MIKYSVSLLQIKIMYNLTKKIIQDVWQFFLTQKENIIHVGKDVYSDNQRRIYLNGLIIDVDSILFENNQLVSYNTIETDKVFNIHDEQVINLNSNYTIESLDENGYGLLSRVDKDWNITSGYGNIKNVVFDFTFQQGYIVAKFLSKKNIYLCFNSDNQSKVHCFSTTKIDFNWHFSLESLNDINPLIDWSKAEVFNFIGVQNNILWMDIVVPDYGGVLLGLDTQTGSVKHLLTECLPMNDQLWYTLKTIPNYCLSRYDEGSNKIIGAARSIYWEVDLSEKTPIMKRWNFEKELEKYHAEFRPSTLDCAITPTHIITPVGGAIPRVVAFNRKSYQIDWCHEFLEESKTIPDFMPQKAEATDTHLFVLISTGDLYIFEKTEDN